MADDQGRDRAWRAGVKTYRGRLEERLKELRGLRSWQLMLVANKSYALLRAGGLRGILEWVRWIAMAPFRGFTGLAEFEPSFPDIRLDNPCEYDLIILPLFEFDSLMQRPQHLAIELARRGRRVFWVSPTKRSPAGETCHVANLRENLWEVRIQHDIPDLYTGELSESDTTAICGQLGVLFRERNLATSCVMVELPSWRKVGVGLREARGCTLVYDCMDNWEAFPRMGQFVHSEEPLLIVDSDLVIASSFGLQQKHAKNGREPLLIRNAADFESFAAGRPGGELDSLPVPIVGYFGAIAEWFDFDLLRAVARKRPRYSFVILGLCGHNPLLDLENVYMLGQKRYEDLPRYLARFDVCIIPFVQNAVTNVTDPVKIYEYFSQGKPVVTTNLRELHEHKLVYVVTDAESFASNIDRSLREDPVAKSARIAFARENTWRDRAEQIDRAIRDSISGA